MRVRSLNHAGHMEKAAAITKRRIGSNAQSIGDIPDPAGSEYEDFLWDELLQAGLEDVRVDPDLRSFFVVSENADGNTEDIYVSADWSSAERSSS